MTTVAQLDRRLWPLTSTLVALLVLTGCGDGRRLDEAMLAETPRLKVRVVRYYEHLFLHYRGEVYRVQCSSERTSTLPGGRMQEPGWRNISNGAAIGTPSALDVAARLQPNLTVLHDETVVFTSHVLQVTFDACGGLSIWDPAQLPPELVRSRNFEGVNALVFSEIRLEGKRALSFRVRSPALRPEEGLLVHTSDAGARWSHRSWNDQQVTRKIP